MKTGKQKKCLDVHGTSTMFMLFEIIALVALVGLAFWAVDRYASGAAVQEATLANELALLVNTLVATPGDVVLLYPEDLSSYGLELLQDNVAVKAVDGAAGKATVRTFRLPAGYAASGIAAKAENVYVIKSGKHIFLSEKDPELPLSFAYEDVLFEKPNELVVASGNVLFPQLLFTPIPRAATSVPKDDALFIKAESTAEKGSVIVSFPVDANVKKSRKLGALLLNGLDVPNKKLIPLGTKLDHAAASIFITFHPDDMEKVVKALSKVLNELQ